eukprot:scaffold281659_cov66-Cyclotella_meneghiniana.AAC.1
MGFIEEKKENDSSNGANCIHGSTAYEGETTTSDQEKIKMMDSFEMEEKNEGGNQNQHGGHSQVGDLLGQIASRDIQQQQQIMAAQQLLAQTSQQHQQTQQMTHQSGVALNPAVVLPQQSLGYLAQSPTNYFTPAPLNLLAVQNALVQNHQQAVVQAQTSALIAGGGVVSPIVAQLQNGFNAEQQLPSQQQVVQQQTQHPAGSSASSISSTNAGYHAVFPITQPVSVASAISPTNQITPANPAISNVFPAATLSAPSIFGPALPAASLTLSPQQTIPHYVPPTPASWGAYLPTLTVQDRPLVPPIYNGINPNYPKAQMLHAHPPIFCVYDFLTPAECDFLIAAASDAFGPAPVVGKGQGEVSPSRTSSTCYLAREDLPEYLRKVSLLTGKPAEHCELPQVGRYLPSQQYLQHFDAFDLSNEDGRRFAQNGGQRTVTVLTYLNDVGIGGQTAFPNLNLQVQPRRGMALVFFPSTLDGLLDKMALHAALPAVDIKYVSQVWIRQTKQTAGKTYGSRFTRAE